MIKEGKVRKLSILLIMCFLFTSFAYAADRVSVQVEFKKFIWLCPVCGQEDIVDANVGGGNEYIHTCKNGHTFNQSGPNMKEYNGTLRYTPEEYERADT